MKKSYVWARHDDPEKVRWAESSVHSKKEHKKISRGVGARVYWRYLRESKNALDSRDDDGVHGNGIYRIRELPELPEKYIRNFWLMPARFREGYREFRRRLTSYQKKFITDMEINTIIEKIMVMREEEFTNPSSLDSKLVPCL